MCSSHKNENCHIYTPSCHSNMYDVRSSLKHNKIYFFYEKWEISVPPLKIHSNKMFKLQNVHKDAVINPALDKSQSDTTANPSSKLLNIFITELNLIDLWRIQNTKAKDFTFFSNRHKTFSRIDYIFLSPSLISSNSSISILPILLSDHSAVLCSVPLSDVKAKSPRWRFNISLLSNQTFITSLKRIY